MNHPSLLEDFLPAFDIRTYRSIRVAASVETVMAVRKNLDLVDSNWIRVLFKMRGIPAEDLTLDGLARIGFLHLAERPDELLLGLVGKFSTPSGHVLTLTPEAFRSFREPGYQKAAFNFRVRRIDDSATELSTETRVHSTSRSLRFRLYWFFVRPFSNWIRSEVLRLIKHRAENSSSSAS